MSDAFGYRARYHIGHDSNIPYEPAAADSCKSNSCIATKRLKTIIAEPTQQQIPGSWLGESRSVPQLEHKNTHVNLLSKTSTRILEDTGRCNYISWYRRGLRQDQSHLLPLHHQRSKSS